ncbi:MAG: hypothetical protein ACQETI_02615 [Halobacteriota archaeon]
MNRRTFIGGIAAGGTGSFAGCLSSSQDGGEVRGEYTADPATTEFDYECQESKLFEDTFGLEGKVTSRVFGTSSAEWRINIDADRILNVAVYNTEPRSKDQAQFPAVEIIDPDGEVVLDGRDSSNLYDITTETDGQYVLQVHSRDWTQGDRWRVEVSWYQRIDCD